MVMVKSCDKEGLVTDRERIMYCHISQYDNVMDLSVTTLWVKWSDKYWTNVGPPLTISTIHHSMHDLRPPTDNVEIWRDGFKDNKVNFEISRNKNCSHMK